MSRIPKDFDRKLSLKDLSYDQLKKICEVLNSIDHSELSKEEIVNYLSFYRRNNYDAHMYEFHCAIKNNDHHKLKSLLLFSPLDPFPLILEYTISRENLPMLHTLFLDEIIDDSIDSNVLLQAVETGNIDIV